MYTYICKNNIKYNNINQSEVSSSSSVCRAGGFPPNVLQPTEAYCINPAFGSPVHLQRRSTSERRERPLSAKGGTMGEKWPIKFSLKNATSTSL
jgi:hypothetical protein